MASPAWHCRCGSHARAVSLGCERLILAPKFDKWDRGTIGARSRSCRVCVDATVAHWLLAWGRPIAHLRSNHGACQAKGWLAAQIKRSPIPIERMASEDERSTNHSQPAAALHHTRRRRDGREGRQEGRWPSIVHPCLPTHPIPAHPRLAQVRRPKRVRLHARPPTGRTETGFCQPLGPK